jgi:lipoprotein-anchoring transpeptidase ErfK/SrfK
MRSAPKIVIATILDAQAYRPREKAMRVRWSRVILAGLAVLMLAGCMQSQLQPTSDAGWSPKDRQLLANPPYAKASIPESYQRHIVDYDRREAPGTVVVDTGNRYLYFVLPKGKAIRYGVTVGEEGQSWSGVARVGRKQEWPGWVPTDGEKQRLGNLPNYVPPGAQNPMGARALYLFAGNRDTQYRIHGTNQPEYIGQAISSGCIRMTNEDVIDLYNRVGVGAPVVVLPGSTWSMRASPQGASFAAFGVFYRG